MVYNIGDKIKIEKKCIYGKSFEGAVGTVIEVLNNTKDLYDVRFDTILDEATPTQYDWALFAKEISLVK